jgi:uncharacterized protein (DUF362 family)
MNPSRFSQGYQCISRRHFIKQSVLGTAGLAVAWKTASLGGIARAGITAGPGPLAQTGQVAITYGTDRADNAFRAMQVFKKSLVTAIGNKHVIVKPNVTSDTNPLACTHVDWLEGILEFLKSIGITQVTVAETNPRNTMSAFDNMGYFALAAKYPVRFVTMGEEGADVIQVWQNSTTTWNIRVAKILRNPNNFVISCPRFKCHNDAVATLGLKCVVMGSPVVDPGFYWGQASSTKYNKNPGMHGNGSESGVNVNQYLNDNIYRLAKFYGIHPAFSVVDGYQGMEGDGPTSGDDKQGPGYVGVAGFDWVAADRVAVKLMGADLWYTSYYVPAVGAANAGTLNCPLFPAYLNYCAQASMGTWDISQITDAVSGVPISTLIANNPGWVVDYAAHSGVQDLSELTNIRTTPKE